MYRTDQDQAGRDIEDIHIEEILKKLMQDVQELQGSPAMQRLLQGYFYDEVLKLLLEMQSLQDYLQVLSEHPWEESVKG